MSLRPHLQLELTNRKPVLASLTCPVGPLADRLARREGDRFLVAAVSVAETQAEKVLSFLRRFALHRASQARSEWDAALVRHIYDVHCIQTKRPDSIEASKEAFPVLVAEDAMEFGRQYPEFEVDPYGVLRRVLAQAGGEQQIRDEYSLNLLPLIQGDFKPSFDEAFASFERVAEALLG